MKNQFFSLKKKKFSDLENLHPGVFRGAEADFEGPGVAGSPKGAWPRETGGARLALLVGRRNGVSPLNRACDPRGGCIRRVGSLFKVSPREVLPFASRKGV